MSAGQTQVTCTTCGAIGSHFSLDPMRGICGACRTIDRKPRTPITLAAAVAYARRMTADGYTVYLRDIETKRTFSVRDTDTAARLDPREPDRAYIAVAVR